MEPNAIDPSQHSLSDQKNFCPHDRDFAMQTVIKLFESLLEDYLTIPEKEFTQRREVCYKVTKNVVRILFAPSYDIQYLLEGFRDKARDELQRHLSTVIVKALESRPIQDNQVIEFTPDWVTIALNRLVDTISTYLNTP